MIIDRRDGALAQILRRSGPAGRGGWHEPASNWRAVNSRHLAGTPSGPPTFAQIRRRQRRKLYGAACAAPGLSRLRHHGGSAWPLSSSSRTTPRRLSTYVRGAGEQAIGTANTRTRPSRTGRASAALRRLRRGGRLHPVMRCSVILGKAASAPPCAARTTTATHRRARMRVTGRSWKTWCREQAR